MTATTEAYYRARVEGRAHSQLRHVAQQVSIIGNMDRVGLVDPGVTYVEFGAGRGMLSLALAAALPKIKLVLVDNSAVRWAPNNTTLLPFPDTPMTAICFVLTASGRLVPQSLSLALTWSSHSRIFSRTNPGFLINQRLPCAGQVQGRP